MATSSTHPLLRALGGVLGILEALIPSLIFVVVLAITAPTTSGLPLLAIMLSGGASVIFLLTRIIRRESLTQAIAGLAAVAGSVILALVSGKAENNFLIGIYTNAAYAVAFIISMCVKWPLIGVAIGLFTKRGHGWRTDRKLFRLLMWLTAFWAVMFALRLAIEVPLYLSQNVVGLGIAKLVLGLPLYAPVVLTTWLFVRGMFIEESTTSR